MERHQKFIKVLESELEAMERQVAYMIETSDLAMSEEQLAHLGEAEISQRMKQMQDHSFRIKMLKQKMDFYKTQLMGLQADILTEEIQIIQEEFPK